MVMAQSLFKLLRATDADIELTVLAPEWSLPLLQRMPEVDRSICSPFRHGELKLWQRLRIGLDLQGQFDTAIVLPNSFKSALIPWFARIRRRVGWRGEFRNLLLTDCRRLDPTALPLMVHRFMALGLTPDQPLPAEIPRPELKQDSTVAADTRAVLQLPFDKAALVICPGAEYGEAKQWPTGHFAELAGLVIARGWQVWIVGSPNDRAVAEEIINAVDPQQQASCFNLTGKTSLGQAADLISLATAVVSNDSGLMHIAAALKIPVVALYGSTSPDFTPPLADRVKLLSTDIDCRPCFQRRCPLGHLRCLTEIRAERVFQELQTLLKA